MNIFWVRFIIFSGLWSFMIILHSEHKPISILCFTIAMGIYFFLSMRQAALALSVILSILIFIHGVVLTEDYLYTILLLVFLSIVSGFMLREKCFYFFLSMQIILSFILVLVQNEHIIALMVMSGFTFFLIYAMNRMTTKLSKRDNKYEQLQKEYRQLKRVHVTAEREARLEERTRIARDMHDSVGHKLTALIMKLEMLAIQHGDSSYRNIKQMAQESLDETRKAVHTLRVAESEGIAAVVHLIRKLEAESHIQVQFTMKQGALSVPLSNEKSVVLYRIIQESLTNAMRHAQAREVHVTLGRSATGDISFEIRNHIHLPSSYKWGFGLGNIKKRMTEINGKVDVFQLENEFVVEGIIPGD